MPISHIMASGMTGIRAAGDLVARMEFSKNMRIGEAKEYVAKKLGVDIMSLTDEHDKVTQSFPKSLFLTLSFLLLL